MHVSVALNDECQKLIPQIVGLVDGSNDASFFLWKETALESDHARYELEKDRKYRVHWDDRSRQGGMQEVGRIAGRPVVVELSFQKIEGRWICFYHGCSTVVDHEQIDNWIREVFPDVPKSDAMNFGNVLNEIRRINALHKPETK